MKVLQVAGLSGPGAIAGGVWRVAATQTDALRAAGHPTTLLSGWLGEPPPAPVDAPLVRLRQLIPGGRLRFLVGHGWASAVRRAATGADVAHVHLCRDFVTVSAVLLLARRGVPVVAQTHGMVAPPRSVVYRLFDRLVLHRVLRRVTLFLALGEFEAGLLHAMGVDPARIALVDNAVPEPGHTWSPARLRPDSPFVFLSRLHERKRPAAFAAAAVDRLADGSAARFVVAGPDEGQAAPVADRVAASGRAERFDLRSTLDHDTTMAVLADARAMVLPSVNEPYPMIVLEAAATGTPVVLTRSCGIAALVDGAGAGLVVEPAPGPIADAMRALETDDDLCARLGRAGRALYERHWRPEALARVLADHYRTATRPPADTSGTTGRDEG